MIDTSDWYYHGETRFSIGDEVVVVGTLHSWKYWGLRMDKYMSKRGTVVKIAHDANNSYPLVMFDDDYSYFFPDTCLEYYSDWVVKEDLTPNPNLKALFEGGLRNES